MELTKEERQVIERLKHWAETDLESAKRALSSEATETDVKIALYSAHTLGIEYVKDL